MIGKTVSHYKILEKLGEGGMGVVYQAEDTKLKRTVALKFLPPELTRDPEAKRRFIHEAQAASALDHANVCTVYEIDETMDAQTFIAMAYYEGETLKEKIQRGPLKIEEAIDFAIQVAEGLHEAHEKGIVHRDVKSANVLVTEKCQIKVMDFGLAKLAGRTKLTKTGTTLGTAAYMSPEQTRGEEVDQRTDIWSLGILLYEMVTGLHPFRGEYDQALAYSIVHEQPEPVTGLRTGVPMELERIVDKALAKEPDERYQHMDGMLVDLRLIKRKIESGNRETPVAYDRSPKKKRLPIFGVLAGMFLLVATVFYFMFLKAPSQFEKKSIAVLPFADMSPRKDQEYFCEGIAEEIINALMKIEQLQVASRTSAFQYKGEGYDIQDIGNKLNVQNILEGSVRKAGNMLRITAQLINVDDGFHLWSDTYDREMEDIFVIQDTITLAIVDNLKLRLLGDERATLVKHHTEDKEAYDLYLKGRYFWNRRHVADLEKAAAYFQQAIEMDSLYAPPYVGIADVYNILGLWSFQRPRDAFPKAKAAVKKALKMDDMLGEAHVSLGFIHTFFDWDWQSAEKEFRRAIELNPSYPMAHQWYALYLAAMERFDEAIEEVERGIELDPLSPLANTIVGAVYYYASMPDQAISQLRVAIELEPNFPFSHYWLGQAYVVKGMVEEAMVEFQKALFFADKSNYAMGGLGMLYAMAGRKDDALHILDRLNHLSEEGYGSHIAKAIVYIALDHKDRAVEHLERAYLEREPPLIFLNIPSVYRSLRKDPKFTELVRKMEFDR